MPRRPGLWILIGLACLAAAGRAYRPASSAGSPYIEVHPGNLPLILSAGHGGGEQPDEVPDRDQAVVVNDWGSQELARDLADGLEDLTGRRPHLVINRLHRTKLDVNRALSQAAQGDPTAERAWQEYHGAIEAAIEAARVQCGRGLYIDLHSYGDWSGVQFGYGLTAQRLDGDDRDLSRRSAVYSSYVRNLALASPLSLAELVRGSESLGGLMESRGYWAVPSPRHPTVEVGYFDGGYSVYRHGSRGGGAMDAVQIEVPYDLLRGAAQVRFVRALAETLETFVGRQYGLEYSTDPLCTGYVDVGWEHWAQEQLHALRQAERDAPCRSGPDYFCPEQPLDRGGAAVMIWAALEGAGTPPETAESEFVDLDDDPVGRAVAVLWNRGYLESCGSDPMRYCPERPMTRAAMAAVSLRVAEGPSVIPAPPAGRYSDTPRAKWSSWWLESAARRGLLADCSRGEAYGCPTRVVSRAEAAWMLARALGLTP